MANEKQLTAMISSTSIDLPDHRKEVLDACLRQSVLPLMMEQMPSLDAEAVEASTDLVNKADIYIGIFAHRYGYIPKENNPEQISVTEMEYNRAGERPIPRFIFFIHDDHPIKKASEIEKGIGGEKLDALKKRIGTERVASFFKSPEDLRGHVVSTLVAYQKKIAEAEVEGITERVKPVPPEFHYVSTIPAPPDTYIAHPYTLLQTGNLVGRQPELNTLTDWVSKADSDIHKTHILNVVAIGGMGKSALTWKWFSDIAPEEMKPLAGRMWWSFYESDATFENFVIRALAYVTGRPIEKIRKMPSPERESELLAALNREPFLIVLDGLERILIAYAGMDASRLNDAQVSSQKNVRKTADPRTGQFLRKLAQIKNSRILISTRLFPAELETDAGDTLPGVSRVDLKGLTEDDAIQLWRAFGVSGSRDLLGPIFDSIDRHPLLIQALAGEAKNFRRAPGDFEKWRKANPRFNPAKSANLQDAMGHVLESALRGLNSKSQQVLHTIAAFRMPVQYDTLASLLIGKTTLFSRLKNIFTGKKSKPCVSEIGLDKVLTELDDRGLVGWDRRANRYDLHPIVRGVVWSGLGDDARQVVYTSLHAHFEAVPMVENYLDVNSLEDLTPAVELYNTLIGMGHYNDAYKVFRDRLDKATLWRLSASRQRVEMLEMLFPEDLDEPRLSDQNLQAMALESLALSYDLSGQAGRGVPMYRRSNAIRSATNNDHGLSIGLCNISDTLRLFGELRKSDKSAREALVITRKLNIRFWEGYSLFEIGLNLAARGIEDESEQALRQSLHVFKAESQDNMEWVVNQHLAQRELWFGNFAAALSFANRAWELGYISKAEGNFIRAGRVQGAAFLGLNDLSAADGRLHSTLSRARAVNLVEEELPALTALAELRRRQGDEKSAREFLDDVWEYAERGPYPTFHADALNVLAQIERDAGNTKEAIEAAKKAYQLSWCDGPPYAYHWGLIKAQKHLVELGAPLPSMPPFDESKYEPMPEVEIDPDDEFHVGEDSSLSS